MRKGILQRLGEWCARHAIIVIVVWLAVLGVLHGLQNSFGGTYSDDFNLPDAQSQKGANVLQANAPSIGGTSSTVVMQDAKPLTDFTTQMNQVVANLQKLDHVLSVQNPLPQPNSSGGTTQTGALSKDGTIGYITVRFDENPTALGSDYLNSVDAAVQPLRSAGVDVEYGGPLGEAARPHAKDLTSEAIGFAVAIVVLVIGFGSLIAAGLPLVTALISVIVGLSCLSLLAAAIDFASVSPTLATMIGLGVGIDYALFLITRYRQLIMDRVEPHVAAGIAVTTSGRAVLVSGCTVIVALAGLYVSGLSFIGRLGVAAAVTVITAVAGALTLVPALAGLIGRQIDRFCLKTPVAEGGPVAGDDAGAKAEKAEEEQHGFWHRYAKRVERRPWWFLASGVVVLGILAIPLFSMRLDHIDDGADPTTFTDRRAFDLISQGFGPGANGPFTLVIDQTNVPSSQRSTLLANLQKSLTGVPNAASISPLQPTSNGNVLTGTALSTQRPQAADTTHLFNHLKDVSLPQGASGTAATTYVTGVTAAQQDFTEIISSRLALIIVVVVCLAFLIILAVFRGLLVAVKAAVLNLFSIGASYGVVVAVFQWGWGGTALGVSGKVPIESYVPMMMFAIIFGLSMDYEIFLLSRVHEAWIRTKRAEDSVAYGLEITARVITCAALIMFSVFAAFILSDNIVVKMLGLGLAVSVLVDATVVRLLLVPAVMTLLGRHAWWVPRWLDRILPHLDTEGEAALHQATQQMSQK
ncbi:MMPL family transporter [Streptacidiphilus melanogenes]|uniref:MMPL family transporter n=1 Tax=Streptacidiphilus melanogenes TaxID=411235 RepID=UPI000AC59266|nr:MMPL family transporter [Streptacidiphilus melanogenes]